MSRATGPEGRCPMKAAPGEISPGTLRLQRKTPNRRAASTANGGASAPTMLSPVARCVDSSERPDDGLGVCDNSDILPGEVDGGAVTRRGHGRAAILGHDNEVALVGAGARRMLDRHIGPGARVDDHVATLSPQDGLETRALPGAHAHLLDHEVAGLR